LNWKQQESESRMRKWLILMLAVGAALALYVGWTVSQPEALPSGFAFSNGRLEAVEIDVATKTSGRVEQLFVDEGDFVTAGQVLAQMDAAVLKAQLKQAEAEASQAESAVTTSRSNVLQRESEKAAATSVIAQREAELDLAKRNLARLEKLIKSNTISMEEFDTGRAAFFSAEAALATAKANLAGADAAISTAQAQVVQAVAAVHAAEAQIERLRVELADQTLKAPRESRVQYLIAEPGEVLGPGGKVLNLLDYSDVYMTFFLPTASAGRLQIGAEARVVLDAAPQFVIPAHVSFVADVAQFTPKTVETAEEREKLMFRIKARIDAEVLHKYVRSAKTGLPGIAYVRLDEQQAWPAKLQVNLPP